MFVESLNDIMQILGKNNLSTEKINNNNVETIEVDEYPRCPLSFSESHIIFYPILLGFIKFHVDR